MLPLEGERDAYYETSQATMKKNAESIRQLRQDNKRLYKKLAEASAVSPDLLLLASVLSSQRIISTHLCPCFVVFQGDESVIRAAFHDRGLEKDAYRNMSREVRRWSSITVQPASHF